MQHEEVIKWSLHLQLAFLFEVISNFCWSSSSAVFLDKLIRYQCVSSILLLGYHRHACNYFHVWGNIAFSQFCGVRIQVPDSRSWTELEKGKLLCVFRSHIFQSMVTPDPKIWQTCSLTQTPPRLLFMSFLYFVLYIVGTSKGSFDLKYFLPSSTPTSTSTLVSALSWV